MKNTVIPVVLAASLALPGAAFAGGLSAPITDDNEIVMLPEPEAVGSIPGSLPPGSGGAALPALLGLLIFGAIGAGGGS